MKKKDGEKSGTARMLELGYKPMQLWLSPTINKELQQLADAEAKPKSRYALEVISDHLARLRVLKHKT